LRKRFLHGEREIFPDEIWVIDERAKQLCISEGIDESALRISGNPYYEWLKKWQPPVSKEKFLKLIGITDQIVNLLVFAPDPLSNVNGIETYGFDEYSATETLIEIFEQNSHRLKGWKVLIKAHPNQNIERLKNIIKDKPAFQLLPTDIDTNSTIYYADMVMGFFSSFLIEAIIMNKKVLRFLDKGIKSDPFSIMNVGEIVYYNRFEANTDICDKLTTYEQAG